MTEATNIHLDERLHKDNKVRVQTHTYIHTDTKPMYVLLLLLPPLLSSSLLSSPSPSLFLSSSSHHLPSPPPASSPLCLVYQHCTPNPHFSHPSTRYREKQLHSFTEVHPPHARTHTTHITIHTLFYWEIGLTRIVRLYTCRPQPFRQPFTM